MPSSLLGGIQTPPLPLVIMSWLNDVISFGGYPDPPLPLKWWRHLWTAPNATILTNTPIFFSITLPHLSTNTLMHLLLMMLRPLPRVRWSVSSCSKLDFSFSINSFLRAGLQSCLRSAHCWHLPPKLWSWVRPQLLLSRPKPGFLPLVIYNLLTINSRSGPLERAMISTNQGEFRFVRTHNFTQ